MKMNIWFIYSIGLLCLLFTGCANYKVMTQVEIIEATKKCRLAEMPSTLTINDNSQVVDVKCGIPSGL